MMSRCQLTVLFQCVGAALQRLRKQSNLTHKNYLVISITMGLGNEPKLHHMQRDSAMSMVRGRLNLPFGDGASLTRVRDPHKRVKVTLRLSLDLGNMDRPQSR